MGLLWDSMFLVNFSMCMYGHITHEIESSLPETLRDPRKLVKSKILMDTGYSMMKYQLGFTIGLGVFGVCLLGVLPSSTFSYEYNKDNKRN
jgi:hypothetical protein